MKITLPSFQAFISFTSPKGKQSCVGKNEVPAVPGLSLRKAELEDDDEDEEKPRVIFLLRDIFLSSFICSAKASGIELMISIKSQTACLEYLRIFT